MSIVTTVLMSASTDLSNPWATLDGLLGIETVAVNLDQSVGELAFTAAAPPRTTRIRRPRAAGSSAMRGSSSNPTAGP